MAKCLIYKASPLNKSTQKVADRTPSSPVHPATFSVSNPTHRSSAPRLHHEIGQGAAVAPARTVKLPPPIGLAESPPDVVGLRFDSAFGDRTGAALGLDLQPEELAVLREGGGE